MLKIIEVIRPVCTTFGEKIICLRITLLIRRKRKLNSLLLTGENNPKAGLTLNDLYDTTCMTHNRFSKFHLSLHYRTSCSYRVHKNCSYKVFSLQEFKRNDSRTSCSSSNYCINFREKQVKKKEIKNETLCETLA